MSFTHNVAAPHRVLYIGRQAPIHYTVAPFIHKDPYVSAISRITDNPHPVLAGVITVTKADTYSATLTTVESTHPADQPWLDLLTNVLRDYGCDLYNRNENDDAYDDFIVFRNIPDQKILDTICDVPWYEIYSSDIFQLVIPVGVNRHGVPRYDTRGVSLLYTCLYG